VPQTEHYSALLDLATECCRACGADFDNFFSSASAITKSSAADQWREMLGLQGEQVNAKKVFRFSPASEIGCEIQWNQRWSKRLPPQQPQTNESIRQEFWILMVHRVYLLRRAGRITR